MTAEQIADEIRNTIDHLNTVLVQADALGLKVNLTVCKSSVVRINQLCGICVDNIEVEIIKRI